MTPMRYVEMIFNRPFGAHDEPALRPGVETPGYSHDVPPGHQYCHSVREQP